MLRNWHQNQKYYEIGELNYDYLLAATFQKNVIFLK
jgi:hypothetical protein